MGDIISWAYWAYWLSEMQLSVTTFRDLFLQLGISQMNDDGYAIFMLLVIHEKVDLQSGTKYIIMQMTLYIF